MRYLTIILLVLLTSSCEDDQPACFKGYGIQVEDRREFPVYREINLYGAINLYLIQDTVNEVVVKTGSLLLDDVVTRLEGDNLIIEDNRRCKWIRKYERVSVYAYFTDLNEVFSWGSCRMVALDTITRPYFRTYSYGKVFEGVMLINNKHYRHGVNFHCTGNTRIAGRTNKFTMMNREIHHVFADSLHAGFADVTNNARGDVYLGPTDSMSVHLWLNGNIYYRGNPEILHLERRSTGRLIKLDN